VYRSPVRRLFTDFIQFGVLKKSPFPAERPNGRQAPQALDETDRSTLSNATGNGATEGDRQLAPSPFIVGFSLLDLLTKLANMEPETLRRVLSEEEAASFLLEQVRWPDGPVCPRCGAEAGSEGESESRESVCPSAQSHTRY
jgi:Transposase zinc-ribbon domain